jgi:hypothetical protein
VAIHAASTTPTRPISATIICVLLEVSGIV